MTCNELKNEDDIDCIVLHLSNGSSNEITIACIDCIVLHKILLKNYRAKHPVKVHVWGRISIRGRTGVCIFDGIMRAPLYAEILRETQLPFINCFCPDHRYMQDNDPKHTSRLLKAFFDSKGVN